MDAPICPICGSPFMVGCNWYSPDHVTYTICARCDIKAYEEPYRSKVIEKLNALERDRKAKQEASA